jgi:uncharacterized membrane protein
VSPSGLVHTETELLPERLPQLREHEGTGRADLIDSWIDRHLRYLALATIAAAFVARVVVASRSYLNPDEALQYVLLNQLSVFLAYKASLSVAHPPLLFLMLYYWHLLGRSELMLRLPSVLLGTGLCWVTFKWVERLFGKAASLTSLIFVAFCPVLIALSAEVRQYVLLLFFMVTGLYFLDLAFEQKSAGKMWCFTAFLYLAILSHYSAVFFVVAAGFYCLLRIMDSHLPRKVVAAWAAGQFVAAGIYLLLYVTQLRKLKVDLALWGLDLDQSYFRYYRDDIFNFTRQHTWQVFGYLFAQTYVSAAMLLLSLGGAAFLFFRDLASRSPQANRRTGILLFFPFVALWGAAIAGVYPLEGSRHSTFVIPFILAAASFGLAAICRQKLWAAALLAAALMGVSNLYGYPTETGFTVENQRRDLMVAALDHVRQSIPRSDRILVDYQSSLPLAYYLCPTETIVADTSRPDFDQFSCNGYAIVSLRFWKLRGEVLPSVFEKLVRAYGLKPGDRVWVFQAGWRGNMVAELPKQFPQFRCLAPKEFGANISVIQFEVGPDLSPIPLLRSC